MTTDRPAFRTVMRGYDPAQVDRRLSELTHLVAEAQSHANALHVQVEQFKAAQAAVPETKPSNSAAGAHLSQILKAAQATADDIRIGAETDAKEKLVELQAKRNEALEEATQEAANIIAASEREAHRIVAEATKRADDIDKDIDETRASAGRERKNSG